MRLPNGYGSVVHMQGNRRRPYMVRKTKGFNEKGHPIYQIIGWTATREEGYKLLADFNHEPWNTDMVNITFADLYKMWNEQKNKNVSKSTRNATVLAYNYSEPLYAMKYRNIRTYHFQACIDSAPLSPAGKATLRTLYHKLDRYAFEVDIISKRYSELLTLPPMVHKDKQPFSDEEIETLWELAPSDRVAAIAVILIYTGWRITELLTMKAANVDTEAGTMQGGIKTAAGKDRIVPIHHRIEPLIRTMLADGADTLISNNGKPIIYQTYSNRWKILMQNTGMQHTIHETRHTFRSRLDSADANQFCVDLLMGHSTGVVQRIYTHKTLEQLKETIELLK